MAVQQNQPLTLRRNFSWTFVGNLVYAACQWGVLVVLAKFGSPEMVGQFTLGLAITAPAILFFSLQLRNVQATDAKQQYVFGDYLGLRLVATGLALVTIAAITFISGYRWEIAVLVLTVGLAKAVESISDIFYGLIQQREQMDRIAISMTIKGLLSLALFSVGVYLTKQVLWGVVGLVLAWSLVLVFYDIRSSASIANAVPSVSEISILEQSQIVTPLRPHWHWETQKQLVCLTFPLGFVIMLVSLNTNIPRYFVEGYLGERDLGFFAAISYLMVATGMVVNALGQSASPRLAKYYAAGDSQAFRQLLMKLVLVGVLLGGTGIFVTTVAGAEILTLMYRPEYAEYANVLVWIMLATAMSDISSFLGQGMTAARYFRIQMPLFLVVTAISAIACFWLIPLMGLKGAAIALLIAAIVQTSISSLVILQALSKIDKQRLRKT